MVFGGWEIFVVVSVETVSRSGVPLMRGLLVIVVHPLVLRTSKGGEV